MNHLHTYVLLVLLMCLQYHEYGYSLVSMYVYMVRDKLQSQNLKVHKYSCNILIITSLGKCSYNLIKSTLLYYTLRYVTHNLFVTFHNFISNNTCNYLLIKSFSIMIQLKTPSSRHSKSWILFRNPSS